MTCFLVSIHIKRYFQLILLSFSTKQVLPLNVHLSFQFQLFYFIPHKGSFQAHATLNTTSFFFSTPLCIYVFIPFISYASSLPIVFRRRSLFGFLPIGLDSFSFNRNFRNFSINFIRLIIYYSYLLSILLSLFDSFCVCLFLFFINLFTHFISIYIHTSTNKKY